jgi:hypothetical protein
MILADVMDELAARIDTIVGLRVFAFPPDSVAPPAAVVTYPEDYSYDETYGRGSDRLTIPVVVMVGKLTDRSSRDNLSVYADGSGVKSIKAVIEADSEDNFLDTGTSGSNGALVPNHSSMAIPGNLWVAVDVALDDWTPAAINTLASRWTSFFNLKSWLFDVQTNGAPRAVISSTGGNDLIATGNPLGFTDATRHAVGVEIVPNDGAGNRTFQFYTASTIDGPWTTHGALITQAGAVSIFNGGANLFTGLGDGGSGNPARGNFYAAEIRSGDRNGTLVAQGNFRNVAAGTYAFIGEGGVGLPWSMINAGAIVAGSPAPYTSFDSARVIDAQFDIVSMAGVEHVAATFSVDVIGEGS